MDSGLARFGPREDDEPSYAPIPEAAMKLGFGLYRHMLTDEYLTFARQTGATHLVVHMCDYFNQKPAGDDQPVGDAGGWGYATGEYWSTELLAGIKAKIEAHGLAWYAIENFDPRHWDHILFDGPKKREQVELVKDLIRNIGAAGIPVIGYNFSLTGVTGRIKRDGARGSATTVGMDGINETILSPMPNAMAWNMVVDEKATGFREPMSRDKLWENLAWFLREVVPVAEKVGVRLALHPDDPPLEEVRGLPKLVVRPDMYQRVIDLIPSRSNALEFCAGTIAEMTSGSVYEAVRQFASQGKIAYVHLRNVVGKVPHYTEVFIDEGEIDVKRLLAILEDYQFDGVVIPDHTPQMNCPAPWHAGMAFAMGYLKSALETATEGRGIAGALPRAD
jgi:mannonate dehydratase